MADGEWWRWRWWCRCDIHIRTVPCVGGLRLIKFHPKWFVCKTNRNCQRNGQVVHSSCRAHRSLTSSPHTSPSSDRVCVFVVRKQSKWFQFHFTVPRWFKSNILVWSINRLTPFTLRRIVLFVSSLQHCRSYIRRSFIHHYYYCYYYGRRKEDEDGGMKKRKTNQMKCGRQSNGFERFSAYIFTSMNMDMNAHLLNELIPPIYLAKCSSDNNNNSIPIIYAAANTTL